MNPEDISILMQECAGKDFDFAEAFLEETDEIQIPFQNGISSGAAAASRQGTGLHLFRGSRSAYLYTNQNSLSEIRRLLALGREILSDSPITGSHQRIISQTPVINPCPVLTYPSEVAVSDKIRILRDMDLSARSASPFLWTILTPISALPSSDPMAPLPRTAGFPHGSGFCRCLPARRGLWLHPRQVPRRRKKLAISPISPDPAASRPIGTEPRMNSYKH